MKVIEIPEFKDRGEVLSFSEECTVDEAVKEMAKLGFGSAVIVDDERHVKGIFTERDVLMKIVAKSKDPKKMLMKEAMTKDPKLAKEDDDVLDCLRRMSQGRFRHLPVVNNENKLVGILSQGDFVALTWGQLFSQLKNQTKASFLSFTQLWMIVAAFALYFLGMILYFHYVN